MLIGDDMKIEINISSKHLILTIFYEFQVTVNRVQLFLKFFIKTLIVALLVLHF